jgi:hypothetical protein
MRMQKEEKIVVVLLFMALGSLAVASWAFSPDESDTAAKEDTGLSLEGVVLEMNPTKTGGHLIIKLDSTQMPVFVPRDAGAEEIGKRIKLGNKVWIRGSPTEYGGEKEIRVDRAEDIESVK